MMHLFGYPDDPRQMCYVTTESNLSRILIKLSMPEMADEQIFTNYLLKAYCYDASVVGMDFDAFEFTDYFNCLSSCLCRNRLQNRGRKTRLIDFDNADPPGLCKTNEEYGFEPLTYDWVSFKQSLKDRVIFIGGNADLDISCAVIESLTPLGYDCD